MAASVLSLTELIAVFPCARPSLPAGQPVSISMIDAATGGKRKKDKDDQGDASGKESKLEEMRRVMGGRPCPLFEVVDSENVKCLLCSEIKATNPKNVNHEAHLRTAHRIDWKSLSEEGRKEVAEEKLQEVRAAAGKGLKQGVLTTFTQRPK
jgi:hypothetical protein